MAASFMVLKPRVYRLTRKCVSLLPTKDGCIRGYNLSISLSYNGD